MESAGKDREIKVDVTVEEMADALAFYATIEPEEISAAYEALLKVPKFGAAVSNALQTAAKGAAEGTFPRDRILDAAVVPAFLIGMLVGQAKLLGDYYAIFGDTGERRLPRPGEWYFYAGTPLPSPMFYGVKVALGYDDIDYGILRLVGGKFK